MEFSDARKYPGYFQNEIIGDRDSTITFEQYFRDKANTIEVWYEVVYWKLFSQKRELNRITNGVIQNLNTAPMITSSKLLEALNRFMQTESVQDFNTYRKLFRFRTDVIAIVATFPAFLNPDRFPMVDTRVAKWVNMNYAKFNDAYPDGPHLIPSAFENTSPNTTLTMRDFPFYTQWIRWTRYMSQKLTKVTGVNWRARDVEMAVFTAWGNKGCIHPMIRLEPF
jgi:hypothetical protein